jgi:acyl-CoA thioester hydrolase
MSKITYDLPIYPFHIDFMGHVNNTVYVQWMEIGRCLLLDKLGMSVAQIAEQGFGPVLVETTITYKKSLYLGDTVQATIWISELAQASAWMDFCFTNQHGDIVAIGRQRGLFVDRALGRPRRLTPEERMLIEQYVIL